MEAGGYIKNRLPLTREVDALADGGRDKRQEQAPALQIIIFSPSVNMRCQLPHQREALGKNKWVQKKEQSCDCSKFLVNQKLLVDSCNNA